VEIFDGFDEMRLSEDDVRIGRKLEDNRLDFQIGAPVYVVFPPLPPARAG
jgi:hypothetical protein